MSVRSLSVVFFVVFLAACSSAAERPPGEGTLLNPDRGRLLYETVCAACHTEQAHWREKRIVRSWPELLHQVDRWQQVAGQGWGAADIRDVAGYLNGRFYQLRCPVAGCEGIQSRG